MASFRQPLGAVVTRLLRSKDLLAAKIGAELIPIIDEKSQQEAITQAFETHSPWICDTTLNSCRLLGTLDQVTYSAIRTYIRSLSLRELFSRFRDINFSLSLSEAFRGQRRALWADLLQATLIVGLALIFSIIWGFSSWMALSKFLIFTTFSSVLIWGMRRWGMMKGKQQENFLHFYIFGSYQY